MKAGMLNSLCFKFSPSAAPANTNAELTELNEDNWWRSPMLQVLDLEVIEVKCTQKHTHTSSFVMPTQTD